MAIAPRSTARPPQLPWGDEIFLDHVGHFVGDAAAAGDALARAGFTPTPVSVQVNPDPAGGAPRLTGTGNVCAMLRNGYLEMLFKTADTPLGAEHDAARDRYSGLHLVAFAIADASASHLRLAAAGFPVQPVVAMQRPVDTCNGPSKAAFEVVRVASGAECERIAPLLDDAAGELADRRDRRVVSRHIRHCSSCRSRYRASRDQTRLLGSLVPTVLLGSDLIASAPPDPAFAMSWWDRVSASAGARSAQVAQVMVDLPALASTKVGAGAIAAAAAGAIGTPVVIDAVSRPHRAEAPTAIVQRAALTRPAPPVRIAPKAPAQAAPAPATSTPKPVRPRTRTAKVTRRVRVRTRTSASTTPRVTSRPSTRQTASPRPAPSPSRQSSPSLEFGP